MKFNSLCVVEMKKKLLIPANLSYIYNKQLIKDINTICLKITTKMKGMVLLKASKI